MDAALLALESSATQIASLIHKYRTADAATRDAHRADLIKSVKAPPGEHSDEEYYLTKFTGCWDDEQLSSAPPVLFTLFQVDKLQQEMVSHIKKVQAVAKGEAGKAQKMEMISDEFGFVDSEIAALKRLVDESYAVTGDQQWDLGGVSWRSVVEEDEVGSCDCPRTSWSIEVLLPPNGDSAAPAASCSSRRRDHGQQLFLFERVKIYQDSKETVTWRHDLIQKVCDIVVNLNTTADESPSHKVTPKSLARLLAVVFLDYDGDYFLESYDFDGEFQ